MYNQSAHVAPTYHVEPTFRMAKIVSLQDDHYMLEDRSFQFSATVAFSCLVLPAVDDIVLYANTDTDSNIIVAIVSRAGEQSMSIEFPEDALLKSKKGSIDLAAENSITFAAKDLNMVSDKVVQKTEQSYINVDEMYVQGEKLNISFSSVISLTKFVSSMAKHVINKFGTYVRHSDQFDQVKAVNMTRSVEELYILNTKQTIMKSEKDTKIDAERIHLG